MGIRLAWILAIAAAPFVANGEIYNTVDANGNVVFTDIAPVDRSGAPTPQPVNVEPMNTYEPAGAPTAPEGDDDDDATAPSYYTQINVVSPAPESTVRDNAGNVEVQVALTPVLRASHRLLLVFDGEDTEIEAVSGSFELTNVDRGTHTVGAKVVDRRGNVLIESANSPFSLMRISQSQAPPVPTPHKG